MSGPGDAVGGRHGIGARARRVEDARFLTGRGRYTADAAPLPGELRAVFVRSPHAHADILSLDPAPALALPGVVAVLTGEDVLRDGVNGIELDFAVRSRDGRPMAAPPRRPLTAGRVRYVGEPVAMVVAETPAAARDGAEAVAVDYAALPAVSAVADAVADAAPRLWDEAPGNVAAEVQYGDAAKTDAAFVAAAHVVRLSLLNQRLAGAPMEPRAAVAIHDALEDRTTLFCSHQTPFPLRTQIAATLNIPEHRLRIISRDVGGGFGVKGPTYPEEVALTWAARRLDRPIRWVCDRTEAFLGDAHARDHATTLEMALDAEGRFLALRVDDLASLGAHVSSFGAGPPIFAQAVLAAGPYRIGAIHGRVRLVFTNTVPTDAYRGAGRPENTYMLERLVDACARDLGIAPDEIRGRNLIPADALPWATPLGRTYDSGDFPGNLRMALEAADHAGFPARQDAARARGKRRGFGLSTYLEHSGMGPSDLIMSRGMRLGAYESAQVRVHPTGGVTVVTGTHSHGQGLATAFAQIVSDRLGVPLRNIEVRHGDTAELGHGRGTVGSRSLLAGGAALGVALDKVEAKARRVAAHVLECAAEDVILRGGRLTVEGTDRGVAFAEVARLAYFPVGYPLRDEEPGLDEGGYWDPKVVALPNGCHACEVEVDPDTGMTTIIRFVAVDDFGNVVNPMIVEGQVQGGLAQGIGQALLEHVAYDAEGQVLAASFMDYAMPRAADLPAYDLGMNPHPTAGNPLGVKGCAESGTIGSPPAVVNAVLDAIGVRHLDMPLTPERVWRAIRDGAA